MQEIIVKQVGISEDGQVVMVIDMPGVHKDHYVIFQPEAIGSRMAAYRLDTPAEAFDAICREFAKHAANLPSEGNAEVHVHGGLHSGVKITHHRHQLGAVLDLHKDRISEAYEDRKETKVHSREESKVTHHNRNSESLLIPIRNREEM